MKAHIIVTDGRGETFEGIVTLSLTQRNSNTPRRHGRKRITTDQSDEELSYSSNPRAFMNKYGKGMSGPQKFTLLLAFLAKGKLVQVIPVEQIAAAWNRMKSVMGGAFNPAYTTRAKDKGWIDSPKKGGYVLSDSWKDVLHGL